MVQGFYTLEEAANYLEMAPEELNRMAQKREIRAFADRGTWRFRTQDVEELARRRSASSGSKKKAADEGVFGFSLGSDENIEIGQELIPDPTSASKSGPKSGPRRSGGSEPRLALDDELNLRLDDEGGLASPRPAKKRKTGFLPADTGPKSGPTKRRSGLAPPPRQDSDVKLSPVPGQEEEVRLESDSKKGLQDSMVVIGEQPPRQPHDSDVRLEHSAPPKTGLKKPGDPESLITEEIDLDAAMPPATGRRKTKPPQLPTVSPFELSEADLPVPELVPEKADTDSSFDLALAPEEGGELKLSPKADDDDAIDLGESPPGGDDVGKSAIFRQKSSDTGKVAKAAADDDVDFDLNPDADVGGPVTGLGPAGDSDFELTLDEDEAGAQAGGAGEKDIFETDFDLPALDDESGSKAVALEEVDTDLESSDFDLALDEGAPPEESGSQVVPLDETKDEPEPRRKKPAAALDEESLEGSIDELLSDEAVADLESEAEAEAEAEEEEEEEELEPVAAGAAPPQPWGVVPLLFLVPSVIVLMLVGMMGFELLHGMWSYQQPYKTASPVLRAISGLVADDLPKE